MHSRSLDKCRERVQSTAAKDPGGETVQSAADHRENEDADGEDG